MEALLSPVYPCDTHFFLVPWSATSTTHFLFTYSSPVVPALFLGFFSSLHFPLWTICQGLLQILSWTYIFLFFNPYYSSFTDFSQILFEHLYNQGTVASVEDFTIKSYWFSSIRAFFSLQLLYVVLDMAMLFHLCFPMYWSAILSISKDSIF
jgi:hypothetical protein